MSERKGRKKRRLVDTRFGNTIQFKAAGRFCSGRTEDLKGAFDRSLYERMSADNQEPGGDDHLTLAEEVAQNGQEFSSASRMTDALYH